MGSFLLVVLEDYWMDHYVGEGLHYSRGWVLFQFSLSIEIVRFFLLVYFGAVGTFWQVARMRLFGERWHVVEIHAWKQA